jgi:hypothetical protein
VLALARIQFVAQRHGAPPLFAWARGICVRPAQAQVVFVFSAAWRRAD